MPQSPKNRSATEDAEQAAAVACHGRRRGRPRDPSLNPEVFTAALSILAELGYERLSMECIAARIGIGKTTLYRRWPNKEQLVVEALMHSRTLPEHPVNTGSLRGDLIALLNSLAVGPSQRGGLSAITTMMHATRATPRLGALIRSEFVAVMRRHTDAALQNAIRRGELEPGATMPPFFADIAPSMMASRLLITGEPVDEEYRVQLVDQLLLPILKRT